MSGSPWSGNGKPVIGDSVRAYVSKILPKKMALEHFPGGDGTAILEGVVTDNTDARGLGIEWEASQRQCVQEVHRPTHSAEGGWGHRRARAVSNFDGVEVGACAQRRGRPRMLRWKAGKRLSSH